MRINIKTLVKEIKISHWAKKLFVLLVLTDICYLVLHLLFLVGGWSDLYPDRYANPYSIEKDHGFAEFFQYMKQYWCVLLLGYVAIKKRSPHYVSWLLLFLYLLVDDFGGLRESVGLSLSNALGFAPMIRLRPQDFGEMIVSAFVGVFFLGCIGTAYRFGDRVFRRTSQVLIAMLLALAMFGIVIDMLHVASPGKLADAFGVLEDGGEMIVMSAFATFIFTLSENRTPDRTQGDYASISIPCDRTSNKSGRMKV